MFFPRTAGLIKSLDWFSLNFSLVALIALRLCLISAVTEDRFGLDIGPYKKRRTSSASTLTTRTCSRKRSTTTRKTKWRSTRTRRGARRAKWHRFARWLRRGHKRRPSTKYTSPANSSAVTSPTTTSRCAIFLQLGPFLVDCIFVGRYSHLKWETDKNPVLRKNCLE